MRTLMINLLLMVSASCFAQNMLEDGSMWVYWDYNTYQDGSTGEGVAEDIITQKQTVGNTTAIIVPAYAKKRDGYTAGVTYIGLQIFLWMIFHL